MRWTDKLRMRLHTLFSRQAADAELDSELRFHLEQQIAENRAAGMTETEARQAALRLFGNPTVVREHARETWSWQWLESLVRDVHQGVRRLRRAPSFAITAIVVLALGIGANIALFTVVNSVLLKPLPVAHPERLVRIYEAKSNGAFQDNVVAGGCFARWQQQARSLVQMGIMQETTYNLAGSGQMPEVVHAEQASWSTLPMLGVHPALGRLFTRDDDRPEANATVVLGWGLWKRRYAGEPVDHRSHHSRGPEAVHSHRNFARPGFVIRKQRMQLWVPVYHERSREIMQAFGSHNFEVIGELRPGVSMAQSNRRAQHHPAADTSAES